MPDEYTRGADVHGFPGGGPWAVGPTTDIDEPRPDSDASAANGARIDGETDREHDSAPMLSVVPSESSPASDPVFLRGFDELFENIEDQWQERALCAQTDPEAFFPEKGGSTREAKRICQGCEVRDECLDYALANDERFGIWGGLSERERRRLKRGIV